MPQQSQDQALITLKTTLCLSNVGGDSRTRSPMTYTNNLSLFILFYLICLQREQQLPCLN